MKRVPALPFKAKRSDARQALLLFRRQFILARDFVDCFPLWQRVTVRDDLRLTVHPDLTVHQVANEHLAITLLGYILDPAQPDAGNLDILSKLLDRHRKLEGVLDSMDRFGGRWVLIVSDGARTIVFNDAVGLRQVHYTEVCHGSTIWCASQPALLAEVLGLTISENAAAFIQSDWYKADVNAETWFPGDTTPYEGVRRLLPNHYLDIDARATQRYWPRGHIEPLSLNDACTRSVEVLHGLIRSAHHRFPLTLAMTAGWDSRLLLAVTRDIAKDIFFFTGLFWNVNANDPDVVSSTRLLASQGIKNHIIQCPDAADDSFGAIYNRNISISHRQYASAAQGMFDSCPQDSVCMKGDVAEIAKCMFRIKKLYPRKITARDLASLAGMPMLQFVVDAFNSWLLLSPSFGPNVLDLFCWEQFMGSCVAMVEAECDIAQETFAPFNCRILLATMLSVPERFRRSPTFEFYVLLMKRLWPAVLQEPINGAHQAGFKAHVRRTVIRSRLHELLPRSLTLRAKRWLS